MPTSITYQFRYTGNYSQINGEFTVRDPTAGPFDLTDADGAVDGSTMPGGEVAVTGGGAGATYVGTVAGGVVVLDGTYILLTDDAAIPFLTPLPVDGSATFTYCYLAGTAILTPGGERAVEALRIGDLVTTHDGRAVPVRWIGRQVRDARVARLGGGLPVRIRAGALGVGADGAAVPLRDLCVSPDHALLVDGLLVHALALVNGTSITRVGGDELAQVAYFHVETADHEIIVADGAPAETFIDNASRAHFDNHAEWLALHPDAPAMRELPLGRVKLARQLPRRIAARLAAVAAGLPVAAVPRVA